MIGSTFAQTPTQHLISAHCLSFPKYCKHCPSSLTQSKFELVKIKTKFYFVKIRKSSDMYGTVGKHRGFARSVAQIICSRWADGVLLYNERLRRVPQSVRLSVCVSVCRTNEGIGDVTAFEFRRRAPKFVQLPFGFRPRAADVVQRRDSKDVPRTLCYVRPHSECNTFGITYTAFLSTITSTKRMTVVGTCLLMNVL